MPTRTLGAEIDRLYQLPLDEFTAARNALAKEAGKDGGEIRKLGKPPAAAWAINQVYWRRRPLFEALTAAAAALRAAHAAVMSGKRADLRAAGAAHEEALDAVLKGALEILADTGQPATDATKQAIATTLRALPTVDEPPGRLTRTLQPGGFELLAGLPSRGGSAVPAAKTTQGARERTVHPPAVVTAKGKSGEGSRQEREDAERKKAQTAERAKAIAAAKESLAIATRVERTADQNARRLEFDAARSAREAERAETRLSEARAALEAAQEAVDTAEEAVSAAVRKKDADARRVREGADALARARVRVEAAQAALARLNG
jgi:hypothetical protein